MTDPTNGRIFVVGCPRSGTTFLQALMVRHGHVTTVPETHFFAQSFGSKGRLLRGLQARRALERARRVAHLSMEDAGWHVTRGPYVAAFLRAMDAKTRLEGNEAWVEKTPRHVFFIEPIATSVPDAQFVHLIRDGRATVASLYQIARAHPSGVWRRYRSIEYCIGRWNQSVSASMRWLGNAGHHVVRYEELARDPLSELQALSHSLGIGFAPDGRADSTGSDFVMPHETWKADSTKEVHYYGLDKYYSVFDDEQRRQVEGALIALPTAG